MMFGRGYYYGDGYGGMMGGYGWLAAILMWVFFAIVLLGIAALVIWAFRSASRHGGHGHGHHGGPYDNRQGGQGNWDVTGGVVSQQQPPQQYGPPPQAGQGGDDAVAIVRRRFANGELTREEYDEMMRALGA